MTREEVDRRIDAGEDKGWVYLIRDFAQNAIKIGWSREPERRLKELEAAHAGTLSLIAVIPGTKHLELAFHRKLIYARRFGEWFEAGAALRLLRPIIRDHGLELIESAADSRNSPERHRYGSRKKRDFLIKFEEVI